MPYGLWKRLWVAFKASTCFLRDFPGIDKDCVTVRMSSFAQWISLPFPSSFLFPCVFSLMIMKSSTCVRAWPWCPPPFFRNSGGWRKAEVNCMLLMAIPVTSRCTLCRTWEVFFWCMCMVLIEQEASVSQVCICRPLSNSYYPLTCAHHCCDLYLHLTAN
jgi:hypothetical protein